MKRILLIALTVFSWTLCFADSFESLRSKATENGAVLPSGSSIEGIIISDYNSVNMGKNIQTAWNKVDILEGYCTGYIQSLDGKYGFRIIFDDLYDNRIPRFSKVSIDLSGVKIYKETDPDRYTLLGVKGVNCKVLSKSTPVARHRHISELTDDDIYTYVTIDDVEFLSKEGSYTNIQEFYVQPTYLNEFKKKQDSDWTDEAGCYVVDKEGSQMFLAVNTVCDWRRRGDRLPQGVGSISGIPVHEEFRRYGNVGRYELRIAGLGDVQIPMEDKSNYTTVAEWNWDRNYRQVLNCVSQGEVKWIESTTRIEADKVLPDVGSGALYTTVSAKMGLTNDFNTRSTLDGRVYEGARPFAAILFESTAAEWFGSNAAVVVEVSTKGFEGSALCFDFTFLAGMETKETAFGYPAQWGVAYSIDGKTFMPVSDTFTLHPIIWDKATNVPYDAAVGYSEHFVTMPAFLLGKEKVYFRIFPAGQYVVEYHDDASASIFTGQTYGNSVFDLRFGKISVKALK